jgi:GNAT superfamily N-acetyltransferase
VSVEVVEHGPLTDAQRAALEGGEEHPFGTEGIELFWRPKERHVMLRDDEGRLIASTGLLVVEVSVGEAKPFEVVGLGGVIVAPGHRGQGLARVVVEAALERAAKIGPELAILFCRDDVAGLYRKLGFQLVEPPIRVFQPTGSVVMPVNTMWRPFVDGAAWPPGTVLVRSEPF